MAGRPFGAFRDESGSVAARLFEIATRGGARSLGIRAGAIESGFLADFFTVEAGAMPSEEQMGAFVLGSGIQAIRRVAVSGRWIHNKSLDLNPIS